MSLNVHSNYNFYFLIMRKSILSLGKNLSKEQKKLINGGNPTCTEWCNDQILQTLFPSMSCACSTEPDPNGTGGDAQGNYYEVRERPL